MLRTNQKIHIRCKHMYMNECEMASVRCTLSRAMRMSRFGWPSAIGLPFLLRTLSAATALSTLRWHDEVVQPGFALYNLRSTNWPGSKPKRWTTIQKSSSFVTPAGRLPIHNITAAMMCGGKTEQLQKNMQQNWLLVYRHE